MSKLLELTENAESILLNRLGLDCGPLRISFCSGTGDVVGTYNYWRMGKNGSKSSVSHLFSSVVRTSDFIERGIANFLSIFRADFYII